MKTKLRSHNTIEVYSYTQKLSRQFLILAGALSTIALAIIPGFAEENLRANPSKVIKQQINSPISNSEINIVKVGVMAIRGVEKTKQKWQPTIDYLSQNIPGYTISRN
ncbi:MAG: hypothetical protein QNJ72_07630 [Pleurocapsa sp. MO_226.B13]|nr:hypothetical protein [Pleurocapsa sp. MO_226.B13]